MDHSESEESNDMINNHPDIERLEQKRDLDPKLKEGISSSNPLSKEEEKLQRHVQRLEETRKVEEKVSKERKEKALKGMKYLLTLSEKYSNFYMGKLSNNPLSKSSKKPLQKQNKLQPTINDMKEVLDSGESLSNVEEGIDIKNHLKYFEGGTLHPYQVEGVSWLAVLHENGINGILADEMGLGKTIQVIALICYLISKRVGGPFLVVAPLSTLPNWKLEFKRFAPKIPVVVFHGYGQEWLSLRKQISRKYTVDNFSTFPVILTSYEVPFRHEDVLKRFVFEYVVVDEGHRIKNHESQLGQALRRLTSSNRLLLTGTPLQNNVQELWALLNFIMPQIFNNMDTFASLIMLTDMKDNERLLEEEEKTNFISTLHKVIEPFMLRRLKKDVLVDIVPKKEVIVYCPLTDIQRNLYTYVIDKNMKELLKVREEEIDLEAPRKKRKCVIEREKIGYYNFTSYSNDEIDSDIEIIEQENIVPVSTNEDANFEDKCVVRLTMLNRLVMYKKIVNHPYLVHFPLDPKSQEKKLLINEDIVNTSGKMMVLDAMLAKLREKGHKVLIFSTLVMAIDLIEELMLMRNYSYRRLDGSCNLDSRSDAISEFNSDPSVLAFLISTRAGGLGLNLTGADTVIFFDRHWNPQVDIQAQDRCHRIGQTKPIMVYTLVSKNTIDEVVIDRGRQKRLLEKVVIQDGKFTKLGRHETATVESELIQLKELLVKEREQFEEAFSKEKLDNLLDRSDLYNMMKK